MLLDHLTNYWLQPIFIYFIKVTFENRIDKLGELVRQCVDPQMTETKGKKMRTSLQRISKNQIQSIKCKECDIAFTDKAGLKRHMHATHPKIYKCKDCDKAFDECWKFEMHVKDHDSEEEFKCDICNKSFFLEWRFRQHLRGHHDSGRKFCHYFNNDKLCPFQLIGCKFKHENSQLCVYGKRCQTYLCQHKHSIEEAISLNEQSIDTTVSEISDLQGTCSFISSTPKKSIEKCDDCMDTSECTDCIVKHVLGQRVVKTVFQGSGHLQAAPSPFL